MKRFKWLFLLTFGLLFFAQSYALNWQWTSFYKVGKPVANPMTIFMSGGTTSGIYISGGQKLFQIGESGYAYSYIPFSIMGYTLFGAAPYTGFMYYTGTNVFRQDRNYTLTALNAPSSTPERGALSGGTVQTRCFTGIAGAQQLFGSRELAHDRKEGTMLYPHLHFMAGLKNAANYTGNIMFTYTFIRNGLPLTVEQVLTGTITIFSGEQWSGRQLDFSVIPTTGYTIGTQIAFRLWRDPALSTDTYSGAICGFTVGIHYQGNTLGSRTITTK